MLGSSEDGATNRGKNEENGGDTETPIVTKKPSDTGNSSGIDRRDDTENPIHLEQKNSPVNDVVETDSVVIPISSSSIGVGNQVTNSSSQNVSNIGDQRYSAVTSLFSLSSSMPPPLVSIHSEYQFSCDGVNIVSNLSLPQFSVAYA